MRKRALKLHAKDNCVVALNDIASGDIVWWDEGEMVACSSVTLGHKLACEALNNGDSILKYGAIIDTPLAILPWVNMCIPIILPAMPSPFFIMMMPAISQRKKHNGRLCTAKWSTGYS
ncbi:UxaA family hydrolase [Escherichia coli]